MKTVRIGSGAGYGGDRIEPAIDLIKRGNLDYIIFECLAERTIALAQAAKRKDPEKGYNELFEYRFDEILKAIKDHPVKVITNMGAANPRAAASLCRKMAQEKGIAGLKIAWVEGDDIYSQIDYCRTLPCLETGKKLSEMEADFISANGYIGCQGIVEALRAGADIVITGRAADPSLSLGPLVYEFGWKMDDYEKLGRGTWVGHLLECAGQATGGYFADPGIKDVPELWNLGFPIIEVDEDGNGIVTKLEGTGGLVSEQTIKEQTLYEIQDPANYYTPDVTADFSHVLVKQIGMNKVRISHASGKKPNGTYKVSVGYHDCWIGEGQISYGGSNALNRARLAKEVLEKRFEITGLDLEEVRFDLIGCNSLYPDNELLPADHYQEIRLRVAGRSKNHADAKRVGEEVEALYTNGPCGGGGAAKSLNEVTSIASVFVDSARFHITYGLEEC